MNKSIFTITSLYIILGLSSTNSFGQASESTFYEFALIHFDGSNIYTSYSSGEVEIAKPDKRKISFTNQTAAMEVLENLSSQGWEVIEFHGYPSQYLLRRTK